MSPRFVRFDKPWGWELVWEVTPTILGRVVHVTEGHRLWLDTPHGAEHVLLCCGLLLLVWEDDAGQLHQRQLPAGHVHTIPARSRHRMIAVEDSNVLVVGPSALEDVLRVEES
ncbi:MAG: hypothetical protein HYU51_14915 [Candidatus Rokubacteria bacterium]|nr:hypothetical protein [Candidatus Rokubacteria bacterium]